MFEKFSMSDIDSAGRGGEYTVQVSSTARVANANLDPGCTDRSCALQAGFGWTNGVLLWVASNYGGALVAPECPPLLAVAPAASSSAAAPSGTGSASASGPSPSTTGAARGLGTPSVRVLGALLAGVVACAAW
jgi:alpha,alpha-trehalase